MLSVIIEYNGPERFFGIADYVYPAFAEYAVREGQPSRRIMVSRNEAYLQPGMCVPNANKETAEQLNGLGRRDRSVIDVACDEERGVVSAIQFRLKTFEHSALIVY